MSTKRLLLICLLGVSNLVGCTSTEKYVVVIPSGEDVSGVRAVSPTDAQEPKEIKPNFDPSAANYNEGYTSFSNNPKVSYEQAKAICEPLASLARSQGSDNYQPAVDSYTGKCRSDYMGGYSCSARASQGGFYGGLADGLDRALSGRSAFKAVMRSCMAEQGWKK